MTVTLHPARLERCRPWEDAKGGCGFYVSLDCVRNVIKSFSIHRRVLGSLGNGEGGRGGAARREACGGEMICRGTRLRRWQPKTAPRPLRGFDGYTGPKGVRGQGSGRGMGWDGMVQGKSWASHEPRTLREKTASLRTYNRYK